MLSEIVSQRYDFRYQRLVDSFLAEHKTDNRQNNNQQTKPEISKRVIAEDEVSIVGEETGVQKKAPVKRETIIDDQGNLYLSKKQRQRAERQQ